MCAPSFLFSATLALAQSTTQPAGATPQHRYWTKDDVAARQEIDGFTSLEDGQPAAPGDWEAQMESGWSTRSRAPDPILLRPTVKYTPHRYTTSGYEFFENMQLRLQTPMELGNGDIDGNGDLKFGWQERWVKESGAMPTLSTLAEVRMPTRHNSNGADGTFTGIVDKDFGPGTLYLNAWVKSANGEDIDDLRPFQWGFRSGYKWRIGERCSLIGDYVHQSSEQHSHANINLLELSAEFRTVHHLAFGPGVFIGLDDNAETPHFGAGFRLVYLFNARNPPPQ